MPELRLNLIAREWVVVARERAKKPGEFRQRVERRYRPEFLDSCPFCPGNEGKTPPEVMRLPSDGAWKIRVTPNKYATFDPGGERERFNEGVKHRVSGVGRHEVIIESPRHDLTLALCGEDEVREILGVYHARFIDAFTDHRIKHVIVFKNHGAASGTTIAHPHTQLVGSPVVPFQIRNRVDEAMRFFDNTGECMVCSILRDELRDGSRVIIESAHFVSFVPYAALSPFHMQIFPKRHMPSFGNTSEEELADLAANLRNTLLKLYRGLDDPDYNLVIRTLSPFRSRSEYIHWYISVTPRLVQTSGFELGSGMHINNSIPEEVAEYLREVTVS